MSKSSLRSKGKENNVDVNIEVEMWEIGKLKPYPKNARIIPESAINAVKNSIINFGFQQPIVVDKDGVVVVGHTRLKAARQLGLTVVPVSVARNLTPQQIDAYRLADNRTNQETMWDVDILRDVLTEMSATDDSSLISMMTGFDQKEVEAYVGELATVPSLEPVEPEGEPKNKKEKASKETCRCPKCGYKFTPEVAEDLDESEDDDEPVASKKSVRKSFAVPEDDE